MSEALQEQFEDSVDGFPDQQEFTEHQQMLMKNQKRSDTINDIVRVYKDEPEVVSTLEKLKVRPANVNMAQDSVGQYLGYIDQYNVTTPEEVTDYFTVIDAAAERFAETEDITDVSPDDRQLLIDAAIARQAVYLGNQRLVVYVAKGYPKTKGLDLLDIIQEGNYGLARAIALFEVSRGHKFSTYATLWISQSIRHAFADTGSLIRLPGHAHDKWLQIQKLQRTMSVELDREPTVDELCDRGKISAEKLLHLMRVANHPLSINAAVQEDSDESLIDFIPDERHSEDEVIKGLTEKTLVRRLMDCNDLTDREKLVIALRHGIFAEIPDNLTIWSNDSGEPIDWQTRIKEEMRAQIYQQLQVESPTTSLIGMKLNHIGKVVGVTTERVRQIQNVANKKAKKFFEETLAS